MNTEYEFGGIDIVSPKRVLGRGEFGEVLLGTFELARCAVKRQPANSTGQLKKLRNEIQMIRSRCNHQNIIRYFCSRTLNIGGQKYVDIVMEMCDVDLCGFINDKYRIISLSEKIEIMSQCVAGVRYLHTSDPIIIHGDIKPSNILISFQRNNRLRVVITDFGLRFGSEYTGYIKT